MLPAVFADPRFSEYGRKRLGIKGRRVGNRRQKCWSTITGHRHLLRIGIRICPLNKAFASSVAPGSDSE